MLGPLARISNQLGRNVMLKSVRNGSHGGVPGEIKSEEDRAKVDELLNLEVDFQCMNVVAGLANNNLPFKIDSKARLTWNFFWYVGSAMAAPFLIVLHQLNKK